MVVKTVKLNIKERVHCFKKSNVKTSYTLISSFRYTWQSYFDTFTTEELVG